jgi:hypothetical protein
MSIQKGSSILVGVVLAMKEGSGKAERIGIECFQISHRLRTNDR